MTTIDVNPADLDDEPQVLNEPTRVGVLDDGDNEVLDREDGPPAGENPDADLEDDDRPPTLAELLRPAIAAGLASSAAGLIAGGIFGSWGARGIGFVAALLGAALAVFTIRSARSNLLSYFFPVLIVGLGAASLVLRGENPGDVFTLIGDAVEAGRLFRPPVPYDPGWTALLVMVFAAVGYTATWIATVMGSPKAAIAFPVPIIGLAGLTQPEDGQFIAGMCAFIPLLAAMATLFGGDADRSSELGAEFELKRALRSIAVAIPIIGAVFALSNASFLFPEPVYDPDDQPQKPRSVPLNAANDRVLFEVATESELTGPWRTGVLDIYDGDDGFWKTAPRNLESFPVGGAISNIRAIDATVSADIIIRDLGNSSVYPTLGGTTVVDFRGQEPSGVRFDPRTNLVRMNSGRAEADLGYTLRLPPYATAAQLEDARPANLAEYEIQLEIPNPPGPVQDLLAQAPTNPWLRLDFLRTKLLENITAAGAGAPDAIDPGRVGEMFEEDAKATPYEIVAAEAMLARWAGVPARIGIGFDGLNPEEGVLTVRPANSAQWIEVFFEGYGWVPLVGAPQQAETSLDNEQQRFNPTIEASDDVSAILYLPFEVIDNAQLFEKIRAILLTYVPLFLVLFALYQSVPWWAKMRRASKRREWAQQQGLRQQILVEYADLRDLALDLNVANIYSTPLEFMYEMVDDDELREFSWLVSRALYGDMTEQVTDVDVSRAKEMGASVRRRLRRGQPFQSQVAGALSRASIDQPFAETIPNVNPPRLPQLRLPRLKRKKKRKKVYDPNKRSLRERLPSRSGKKEKIGAAS